MGDLAPRRQGRGVADQLEIRPSAMYVTTPARFGRSESQYKGVTEILQKILTLRIPLSKAIQGHWNQRELWLPIVIHSNHGPISYRFRDERVILVSLSILSAIFQVNLG